MVCNQPLIVANWKLHGDTGFAARLLGQLKLRLAAVEDVDVVVCLPFVLLPLAHELLDDSNIALGAQHVSDQGEGAYTGEVSARMLKDIGCDYVIVGHSERRHLYHEDDQSVARRLAQARTAGLIAILCVGETLAHHKAGTTDKVIATQLKALDEMDVDLVDPVIAYEPVWAIGTGQVPSTGQLADVRASIQVQLEKSCACRRVRVIYGGSITPENALELFGTDDIDGGLVGGASLDSDRFCRIVRAAESRACGVTNA